MNETFDLTNRSPQSHETIHGIPTNVDDPYVPLAGGLVTSTILTMDLPAILLCWAEPPGRMGKESKSRTRAGRF